MAMAPHPLDRAAQTVLARAVVLAPTDSVLALGNAGGFSGARLWRIEGATHLCLKAWPPHEASTERLRWIHQLMEQGRAADLPYVPQVVRFQDGTTWQEEAGRLWDLTGWMPGRADYHDHPSVERVEAACTALARLHLAWAGLWPGQAPCPAIARRIVGAQAWSALVRTGWRPQIGSADPVRPWAERAWHVLRLWALQPQDALLAWASRPVALQPCLCDIWHDHVLFQGDVVTGIIDYSSAKFDHVAVDLARLLGSLVGNHAEHRAAGLRAYECFRPLSWDEEALVSLLDETGVRIGVANWLTWLYHDRRSFEDRQAVARRLQELVKRLEGSGGQ